MSSGRRTGPDTDLLRDLGALIQQGHTRGAPAGGNIEVAAARMQAVKGLQEEIRTLHDRKITLLSGDAIIQQLQREIAQLHAEFETIEKVIRNIQSPLILHKQLSADGHTYTVCSWIGMYGQVVISYVESRNEDLRNAEYERGGIIRKLEGKKQQLMQLESSRKPSIDEIDRLMNDKNKMLKQLLGI